MQHDTQYNADNPYVGSNSASGTQAPPPAPPAPPVTQMQQTTPRPTAVQNAQTPPTFNQVLNTFFAGTVFSDEPAPTLRSPAAPLEPSALDVAEVLERVLSLSPVEMAGRGVQLTETPVRTSTRGISRTPQAETAVFVGPPASAAKDATSPSTGGTSYDVDYGGSSNDPYTVDGTATAGYTPMSIQLEALRTAEAAVDAAEAADAAADAEETFAERGARFAAQRVEQEAQRVEQETADLQATYTAELRTLPPLSAPRPATRGGMYSVASAPRPATRGGGMYSLASYLRLGRSPVQTRARVQARARD